MRIKSNETFDGGGRCMLVELLVEGGGSLQSITLTDEYIVGRKIPFQTEDGQKEYDHHEIVLWEVSDKQSLHYIPDEIKAEVLQAYQDYRKKYHCDIDLTRV
ncbi:hypothetical protein [Paenibacillus sinopodophylli]|uniref:hypothetical protein n=1 Tax=Paenibacillus sinopodophylli TaxID=1837342 RepID=UPI00110CE809|nr:hypothetical protein [Paenibacillus sinopodophylli]